MTQCRRSMDICKQIIEDGMSDTIREKTGLVVDLYFTATQIRWILDHDEDARQEKYKMWVNAVGKASGWLS